MKNRTIIDAIVMPFTINLLKQKKPIEISIGGIKRVSFKGFRDVQHLLQCVAAVKINPIRINTKVKFTPSIKSQSVEYDVIFKSQSELFRQLLEEKKEEIKIEAISRYERSKRRI